MDELMRPCRARRHQDCPEQRVVVGETWRCQCQCHDRYQVRDEPCCLACDRPVDQCACIVTDDHAVA